MTSTRGAEIRGVDLDPQTRCGHYRGPTDIVAIKFKCCGTYWACKDCHLALADHAMQVWSLREREVIAMRCGACGTELTIAEYLAGGSRCPACRAAFNPRCERHHHYYFEV